MFELVYLYEQLKTDTIKQDYIDQLNVISESAYDNIEVGIAINETMEAIDEAAKKNGFGKINALKAKIMSTQKVLDKCKDKALKFNPIGLTYSGYKTFKSDADIKKLYDQAIKYLNSFNPNKATEEQLKKYIQDAVNNVQLVKISEIFGNGKTKFQVKDIVVTKIEDKNISKNDISAAIKEIESGDKKLKFAQAEQKKRREEYVAYARNGGLITNDNTSIDKLKKNSANYKRSLIDIANTTYFQMFIQKYTQELEQCKRIVVKAASYNPRNLKESYEIQDYIDYIYAFNEYTEFIDEL